MASSSVTSAFPSTSPIVEIEVAVGGRTVCNGGGVILEDTYNAVSLGEALAYFGYVGEDVTYLTAAEASHLTGVRGDDRAVGDKLPELRVSGYDVEGVGIEHHGLI